MSTSNVVEPLRIADASESIRHVFVRNLSLQCSIGIHPHELEDKQTVRICLDLGVLETNCDLGDSIDNVVCYEDVRKRIKAIAEDGHVNLVETLAERIAAICLQDPRCRTARVKIEKLEAFDDVESVGVEIERRSTIELPA